MECKATIYWNRHAGKIKNLRENAPSFFKISVSDSVLVEAALSSVVYNSDGSSQSDFIQTIAFQDSK